MVKQTCILLLSMVASASTKMEGFVVGGQFANIEHHAHSAFLSVYCVSDTGNKTGWICGSSVVNQMILLTAGHCLYGCSANSHIAVNLGNEHRHKGKIYSAFSYMVHENYSPKTSLNDISLLRVDRAMTLNKKISRVALMRKPPYSELAKVAGWGYVDVSYVILWLIVAFL